MAGKARRNHGGTLRELASGRIQARLWDPDRGRHVSLGTFPTKSDARTALTAAVTARAQGTWVDPDAGRDDLPGHVAQWIATNPRIRSQGTRDLYTSLLRTHIEPAFNGRRLNAIKPAEIRAWRSRVATEVSESTAAKAYRLLRASLNTAVEDRLIPTNPCQIKGGGDEHTRERPIATVAEVGQLVDATPERFRLLVLMATWTSLRSGELYGLQRHDLDIADDLESGIVHVRRQRVTEGGRPVVKEETKSSAGRRRVSIPPPLLPVIVDHLDRWVDDGSKAPVFTREDGKLLDRRWWSTRWAGIRSTIGRDDLHFHDLRHTGNTLAAASGASLADLMNRMGHASPRAAMIYQHATQDADRAIAEALGTLMDDQKPSRS